MKLPIPVPTVAMTASEFVMSVKGMTHAQREDAVLKTILEGHVPSYMRETVSVAMTFRSSDGFGHVLTIEVLPNYLFVGTDDDRINIPVWPVTAQKICDAWNCSLPTTRIVDVLFNAASRIAPSPWGPPYDAAMQTTSRFVAHNKRVEDQISGIPGFDKTRLVAGHKKDIVITNKLAERPNQVAIYGWHQLNGRPIQTLYLGHEAQYTDYSHGVRLVSCECELDGYPSTLSSILTDANLCEALSNEGPMKILRQP